MALPRYNINPPPQPGTGAYGTVPGTVGLPDPFVDLSRIYPNLSGANSKIAGNIGSELNGELSPETIAQIQDDAARFGVSSGMPGSGLAGYRGLRSLGLNVEAQKRQGLQDYNSLIPNLSKTQTVSPETQINLADRNSVYGAAPNPTTANEKAQSLFRQGGSFSSPGSRSVSSGGSGGYFRRPDAGSSQGSVMDVPNYPAVSGSYNPTGVTPSVAIPGTGQQDFSQLFNFDGVDKNSFFRADDYDPNAAWINDLIFGGGLDNSQQDYTNVSNSGGSSGDWMDTYY